VLRALALFGVLVVNVTSFSGHDFALEQKLPIAWGWGGTLPAFLRGVFIESKAAALLGMLFGAGLVIQCERSHGKAVRTSRLHCGARARWP